MAGAAKERLGKLPCTAPHGCGEPTHVLRSESGALSMACPECGWSCHARKGDPAHAALIAKLDAKPAPAPAPEPAPGPSPTPPKAARSVFDLGALA